MLQNESQTDQTSPIGQIRIKPEELTSAVAAIERRKQEEAQHFAQTIPIEQAVSDLHLDSTPEEIWAEVQAQRAREASVSQSEAVTPNPQKQILPPPVFRRHPRFSNNWRALILMVTMGTMIWILNATDALSHHAKISHHVKISNHAKITVSSSSPAPAATTPLDQITDGQEVFCSTSALVQLSEAKPLSDIRGSTGEAFDNSWTLVKMRGHVYLHAYILSAASLKPLKGQSVLLCNTDNSGALEGNKTSKITLRIDNVPLQVSGGDNDYSEITVPNFAPDQFTTISEWH